MMQDSKDRFTHMGQFPRHKTGRPGHKTGPWALRNSRQLKLILAVGHSESTLAPVPFASQP